MPNINSSFHSIAEQIMSFNNNVVQILGNINSLTTTTNATIPLTFLDSNGAPVTTNLPSFNYLQNQINIMNNNINTLYGLNSNGAVMQTSPNSFQRIITVDLNLEPADISSISVPTNFISQKNYLFDALLDPELFITLDLTNQIDSDVREILTRRYIVNFEIDSSGVLTNNGLSALNSFNTLWNGNSNIVMNDFLVWQQTTPGVLYPTQPEYIEETISIVPNQLKYYGIFSVLKSEIDSNNILWYYVDTLTYTNIQTNQPMQLAVGDTLIINMVNSNTLYQITQISNSSSNPKISLTRTTGNQPIPPGIGILKFYSAILQQPSINIPIGYSEYNIVFVKSLNTTNFILSKNWSNGIGYFTNNLSLSSSDSYNGQTMQQYYSGVVSDYGLALKDLVSKIPVISGVIPTAPLLINSNFSVVQTNIHLTDTTDTLAIKSQAAQLNTLNTQAAQLSSAIQSANKQIQVTRFASPADQQTALNNVASLQQQHSSTTALAQSINNQILASPIANTPTVTPTYAIRGFWTIPSPSLTASTVPQEIVKFDVEYQKLSKDGTETPIKTFNLADTSVNPTAKNTAAFSNWIPLTTLARTRSFNAATGAYTWIIDDQSDPNVVNINQLDIPILPNETIEIRMKSISEVGYPDSPLESDWSNSISITFPDNLTNVTNQISTIINNSQIAQVQNNLMSSLNNQGLNDLLSQKTVVNNSTYYLSSNTILSGFKDINGNSIDLFTYLQSLTNTITALQAQIANSQGNLVVTIFNNSTPYVVQKNTVLNFTINCEDYMPIYTGAGVPTGRVYANNIYSIKNYYMTIQNTSATNALGLLSNITYTTGVNTDVYNSAVPQIFWVDAQDNLITSDVTGQSKTQIDNQFLWSVNYYSVDQTTVTQLSDDIGNLFSTVGNNSLTSVLSSTEYNLGYADPSVLSFIGNNNSLIDSAKWIDNINSISSTNKLLTTIHPSVQQLTDIQETNTSQVYSLTNINTINIPLNIYFKLNALDNTQAGINYQYVVLNGVTQNIRHIKKLKFLLNNQADNTPFVFTIVFTINRVNVIQQKTLATSPSQVS